MSTNLQLPLVPAPDWEATEDREGSVDDESGLQGIAESLALHHSLRQSRNAWLTSVFPKFSSKVRGKHQPEGSNPHPHTVRLIGKCDLEIGPHVFHDTSFFEAQYISEPAQVPTYQFTQGASYSGLSAGSFSASSSTNAASPLMSSLDSSIDITPHLIAQVNAAASSNPVLQNLLHAAAHNNASLDQLKTLATLIQSLATQPTAPYPNATYDPNARTPALSLLGMNPQALTSQVQVKKSDLLIEFRENQVERLLIPHDIAFGERNPLPNACSGRSDMDLGMFIPLDDSHGENAIERPAILRLRKVPSTLSDTIWYWLSENARMADAKLAFQRKVKEGPERVFLQHRLADDDLLSQLRSASKSYPMKSIKPSASTLTLSKPKRSPRKRKPPMMPPSMPPPDIPPTPSVVSTPITVDLSASDFKRQSEPAFTPTQKKRKVTKAANALPPFACSVCGMTDVPLMQGGRFCRTCLDSGAMRNATLQPALPPPPELASMTRIAPQPFSQIGRIDTFRGFIHHTVPIQPAYNNQSVT